MDCNLISSAKCYLAKYKCFLEFYPRGIFKEARDTTVRGHSWYGNDGKMSRLAALARHDKRHGRTGGTIVVGGI